MRATLRAARRDATTFGPRVRRPRPARGRLGEDLGRLGLVRGLSGTTGPRAAAVRSIPGAGPPAALAPSPWMGRDEVDPAPPGRESHAPRHRSLAGIPHVVVAQVGGRRSPEGPVVGDAARPTVPLASVRPRVLSRPGLRLTSPLSQCVRLGLWLIKPPFGPPRTSMDNGPLTHRTPTPYFSALSPDLFTSDPSPLPPVVVRVCLFPRAEGRHVR